MEETKKYYTVTVMDDNGYIVGEMQIDKENVCWTGDDFSSVIERAAYEIQEEM